jgi:beta-glucosidase
MACVCVSVRRSTSGSVVVTLEPGEIKHVEITLSPEQLEDLHLLQYWDPSSEAWTTAGGTYTVSVGGSLDTAVQDTIEIHHAS